MPDPWFVPKTYGYGAIPSNWKGRALIAAFVAAVLLIVLGPPAARLMPSEAWPVALVVVLQILAIAGLTFGFIRLSRAKTDGPWRWRWSEKQLKGRQ